MPKYLAILIKKLYNICKCLHFAGKFARRSFPQKSTRRRTELFMFKEITENTLARAKEEVAVAQWIVVLIALVSFLTGLVVGILCASGSYRRKNKKNFNARAYVHDLDFDYDSIDDEDDDEGSEYSF